MQIGAVLMLDTRTGLAPGLVERTIAGRVAAVPRLRQRLVSVPVGCGRPVWVDDRDFEISHHVSVVPCPAPGGAGAVLEVAAELLGTPLRRSRPLGATTLLTDVDRDGRGRGPTGPDDQRRRAGAAG